MPATVDLALVGGVVLLALALPSVLADFAEERSPRLGALLSLAGAALAGWGVVHLPGGLHPGDVPDAFVRVIAMLRNARAAPDLP